MQEIPKIPGYPELKLLKIGPEGNVYISDNPNAIIKVFYYTGNMYDNELIRKNCKTSIHFSNLIPQYVPKIYSKYKTKSYVALIMENIESMTLHKNKKHKKNYNVVNVFKILRSLIQAVFRLHEIGYVHYDLHAENILVTKDFNVKLIDFSLCDDVNAIDDSDETCLKIHQDHLDLKYHIAHLIFPNLPLCSIYDTMNIIKTYTVKDVIGYDTHFIVAEKLYELLGYYDDIQC